MILNCSSHEFVKKSLSEIFQTTVCQLLSVLSEVENDEDNEVSVLEKDIYASVCKKIGAPCDHFMVLWFHGTRAQEPNSFYKYGILTKNEMSPKIYELLSSLSYGLEKYGEYPFEGSRSAKLSINDEGPFAVLFKCLSTPKPGQFRDYTKVPEIVEDIAGILLGGNYKQLTKRFQKNTTPCVVSFLSKPLKDELLKALLFLKLIEDGKTEYEASTMAVKYFDSEGEKILPNQVVDVETL